ncbi:hypothetical protein [Acrocarpospora pleiomorpha]|nr:hypothetical protein [Acrocarpospora pleiomorpha]
MKDPPLNIGRAADQAVSWLFVPGHRPELFAKAVKAGPHMTTAR